MPLWLKGSDYDPDKNVCGFWVLSLDVLNRLSCVLGLWKQPSLMTEPTIRPQAKCKRGI
jgi:hypothetical protein